MRNAVSFVVGLVFGIGLCISGMTEPAKVIGFLDLAGVWDPSLALVMAGAVGVGLVAFWLAKKRNLAIDGDPIQLPTARVIDRPLLLGSLIFGIGWGLAGICPGPAIVDAGFLNPRALVFAAAMAIGMLLYGLMGLGLSARDVVPQDA
jgi:uncharacterized membrane protein YedE/YeeE